MEEILNQFSLMNTDNRVIPISKHEQLFMFKEEISNLLKYGCNEYQYNKFDNFNRLIKADVNLNDDIYPKCFLGLLIVIRETLIETETGDIFKRLLYSFNLYNSILALLRIMEEIETEETHNYCKQPTSKQPNDGFWNEW
jgi:hypothetical protein